MDRVLIATLAQTIPRVKVEISDVHNKQNCSSNDTDRNVFFSWLRKMDLQFMYAKKRTKRF